MLPYAEGFVMPCVKSSVISSDQSLTYHTALRDLRTVLRLFGVDPRGYGEHPGRRGGTTAAAAKGPTLTELMMQGKWRSESMPRLYTDNAIKCKRKFARRLAIS